MKEKNMTPLNVVLYWHMHQPEYRDLRNGEYHLPWTYLHTIKDYVDMVAHLEECEAARVVVNFAPVLLEQIDDYRQQLHDYLFQDKALRDPLLAALAGPVLPSDPDSRLKIMKECLRANEQRLIARNKPFKKLAGMAKTAINDPDVLMYHTDQFLSDLLIWYHISWIGETVRRNNPLVESLIKKAHQFTLHDRRQLIELTFDFLPFGQGIDEQATVLVDGDDQLRGAALLQRFPVLLGNRQPPLGIQGQCVDAPKQARAPP